MNRANNRIIVFFEVPAIYIGINIFIRISNLANTSSIIIDVIFTFIQITLVYVVASAGPITIVYAARVVACLLMFNKKYDHI